MTMIVMCACGQTNRVDVDRLGAAVCGKCRAALVDQAEFAGRDEKLSAVLEKAGLTFEQAEQQALAAVRAHVAKYGDNAPTTLAFSAYKAMRRDPESRDTIVLGLAKLILAEAT